MAKKFWASKTTNVRVGIVAENQTAGLTGTNITALGGDGNVGSLYDGTGANDATYTVLQQVLSVSVDKFGTTDEDFQQMLDNYDHHIELREDGSGSVEMYALDDSGTTIVDAYNLLWAGAHFPHGFTNSSGDASYSGVDDTNAGTEASDLFGWAIVVEQKIEQATPQYATKTFHNCSIEVTPSFTAGKTSKLTLKWSGARSITVAQGTSAFTNHVDA